MQLSKELLKKVITIAHEAGRVIMSHYYQNESVEIKADGSPVTQADQAADDLIKARLAEISNIPYFSEESADVPYAERSQWTAFWLVDPLDGTKEFIKRTDEFTVNIALIREGQPVLGVVYVPAKDITYAAYQSGGAYKIENDEWAKLPLNTGASDKLRVVVSKSHLNQATLDYIDELKSQEHEVDLRPAGSSLKFCLVAEGSADIYPRLGPIMEWDIAAAIAIVRETDCDLPALTFNSETLRINQLVSCRAGVDKKILTLL